MTCTNVPAKGGRGSGRSPTRCAAAVASPSSTIGNARHRLRLRLWVSSLQPPVSIHYVSPSCRYPLLNYQTKPTPLSLTSPSTPTLPRYISLHALPPARAYACHLSSTVPRLPIAEYLSCCSLRLAPTLGCNQTLASILPPLPFLHLPFNFFTTINNFRTSFPFFLPNLPLSSSSFLSRPEVKQVPERGSALLYYRLFPSM